MFAISDERMVDAISIACKEGFHGIVQCLLEHDYSKYVRPHHLRDAQFWGHEDIAGLLRPILSARGQLDPPLKHNLRLEDYQMQIMLLEKQHIKRSLEALQER